MRWLSLVLLTSCALLAQPQIKPGGIVNAASYFAITNGTNPIAQGSYFVIFGSGLGPANIIVAPSLPFTTQLPDANGTSVKFTVGNQSVNAFMYYAVDGQVAGILPSNAPIGLANVTVSYKGQTSRAAPVFIIKANPGLFTQNQAGTGAVKAQVYRSATDVSELQLTNPALPGNIVALYGTGLGATQGKDNDAPGAVQVSGAVTVFLNGFPIKPTYAGRAPQYPGLDQVNFQIPDDIVPGCYSQVFVSVDGGTSNIVSIPTASSGSTCVHPFGLDRQALAKLDSGGKVNLGFLLLVPGIKPDSSSSLIDGSLAGFFTADATGAYLAFLSLSRANQPEQPVSPGKCVVWDQFGPDIPDDLVLSRFGVEFSAGDKLTLSGPGGKSLDLVPGAIPDRGGYGNISSPGTLTPGTWTLQGTGGVIGAFSADMELPQRLAWINPPPDNAAIPRTDQTVNWTGGGDTVVVGGYAVSTDQGVGKRFSCGFRGSDGRGTVPANVLNAMPLPPQTNSNYEAAFGINSAGTKTFSIPGKIDGGLLIFGMGEGRAIRWR